LNKKKYKRPRNFNSNILKIAGSLIAIGLLFYFSLGYFGQTGAQDRRFEQNVGRDLMIAGPEAALHPTGSKNAEGTETGGPERINGLNGFITPSTDYIDPFEQHEVLEYITHEVKPGESLWAISNLYGRRQYTIASANYDLLRRYNSLPVGIELRIPNRDGVVTELSHGQTLSDIYLAYGVSPDEILEFNELDDAGRLSVGQELFIPGAEPLNRFALRFDHGNNSDYIWPLPVDNPRITSGFGDRIHPVKEREIFHTGIDIAAAHGKKAYSARDGRVNFVGVIPGYGNVVTVIHSNRYKTLYAHLSEQLVRPNQFVEQGQPIGRVGATGYATGPHLHFEIRRSGNPVNPLEYLPDR